MKKGKNIPSPLKQKKAPTGSDSEMAARDKAKAVAKQKKSPKKGKKK